MTRLRSRASKEQKLEALLSGGIRAAKDLLLFGE